LLLDAATLGEIRYGDGRFVAETRDAFHALDQERGRLYAAACSAELGDGRCRVDLGAPPFRFEGTVASTDGHGEIVSPAAELVEPGFFARGTVRFLSGASAGRRAIVKDHRAGGRLVFWQRLGAGIAPGDQPLARRPGHPARRRGRRYWRLGAHGRARCDLARSAGLAHARAAAGRIAALTHGPGAHAPQRGILPRLGLLGEQNSRKSWRRAGALRCMGARRR
ncbi:MAG: DUF2163 domain-containing protein, partial [Proteobacteria bacterium]|nr:DUF2163 domain-containing protein [Pseudomonadota bacterium]